MSTGASVENHLNVCLPSEVRYATGVNAGRIVCSELSDVGYSLLKNVTEWRDAFGGAHVQDGGRRDVRAVCASCVGVAMFD
jgi:hypothetical protein